MPKLPYNFLVSFELDVLLLEEPSDLGDNVGCLGFRYADGLGLTIDDEPEDVFFMAPLGIAFLEFLRNIGSLPPMWPVTLGDGNIE